MMLILEQQSYGISQAFIHLNNVEMTIIFLNSALNTEVKKKGIFDLCDLIEKINCVF